MIYPNKIYYCRLLHKVETDKSRFTGALEWGQPSADGNAFTFLWFLSSLDVVLCSSQLWQLSSLILTFCPSNLTGLRGSKVGMQWATLNVACWCYGVCNQLLGMFCMKVLVR